MTKESPEHNSASAAPPIPEAIRPGLSASVEKTVPREWTIAHYDPRLPSVFSTPAMIGMMEVAAAKSVQPHLAPGTITVGTRIEVDHLKACPEGSPVIAEARLTEIRGRFLVFDVEARSGRTLLGQGRVYRAIVELTPFHSKASKRSGH